MNKHQLVLEMLLPNGGYIATGDTFEGIEFIECEPITKAQYDAGVAQYDAWKAEQEAAKAHERSALLTKLGITEEEAALLLGGN
jgi:hypothetical protein